MIPEPDYSFNPSTEDGKTTHSTARRRLPSVKRLAAIAKDERGLRHGRIDARLEQIAREQAVAFRGREL